MLFRSHLSNREDIKMAKFAIVLFAAFALTFAAPKQGQTQDVAQQIQAVVQDISTNLEKNLPDSKDIAKTISTQSHEFAQNVENIVKTIQTELENNKGKSDDVLKQVSAKVTEAIGSLKQLTGPEATAKANELKTQVDNNLKTIAAEFEKLGQSIKPDLEHAGDSVSNLAKGVLDDFVKAAQNFQTQVQSATKKN